MILCVDIKALKTSEKVQKDIDLEDLLVNHIKYFDNDEEALKEAYVPLDFSVTIRSMYSNKVVQIDAGEEKRYYINLTQTQEFIHKGYDLVMYLTSIGVMHIIDYAGGFDDLMMKHSQFSPIGIYNPDSAVINPIVYTHIIMSDEGMEELSKYLKCDRSIVGICTINEHKQGNLPALLETLIEVKESAENE